MFARLHTLWSSTLKTSRPPVRRTRPAVEALEDRQLLALTPTLAEQYFLELLNNARDNPTAYGAAIGEDLSYIARAQPLAFDERLIEAAHNHSVDMLTRNYREHNSPEGITPQQRIDAAGYPQVGGGESIVFWMGPERALEALIRDAGHPDLGHRHQLLGYGANAAHQQVGVGIAGTGSSSHYTIDTGYTIDTRPFLTGVVYRDLNGNGRYSIGTSDSRSLGPEGVGGATVTVYAGGRPVASTTTWDTGGYTLQLDPETTYTVSVSSSVPLTFFEPVTLEVGSQNVRVNFGAEVLSVAPARVDARLVIGPPAWLAELEVSPAVASQLPAGSAATRTNVALVLAPPPPLGLGLTFNQIQAGSAPSAARRMIPQLPAARQVPATPPSSQRLAPPPAKAVDALFATTRLASMKQKVRTTVPLNWLAVDRVFVR